MTKFEHSCTFVLLYLYTFVTLVKWPNLPTVVLLYFCFVSSYFLCFHAVKILLISEICIRLCCYSFAPDYNFFSTFDIASQVSQAHSVSAALWGGRGERLLLLLLRKLIQFKFSFYMQQSVRSFYLYSGIVLIWPESWWNRVMK